MRLRFLCVAFALCVCLPSSASFAESPKPAITLDEFLNTTEISAARIAPDGSSAVIATRTPDWKASTFRNDLWLWSASTGLRPLTHSGSEENPEWSPDGKWIAFVSDRALSGEPATAEGTPESESAKAARLWIIPVTGGEALPLYTQKLDVHSFAWSPDGASVYYSATAPLTHEQEATQKVEWKDVTRWREQHRGDLLLKQAVTPAMSKALSVPPPDTSKDTTAAKSKDDSQSDPILPPGAETIATSTFSIGEIRPSPDSKSVAFMTEPAYHRMEGPSSYEIFLVASNGGEVRQLTHNQAIESGLFWSADSRNLHFSVQAAAGSLEGKYRDVQGRLYKLDPLRQNRAARLRL